MDIKAILEADPLFITDPEEQDAKVLELRTFAFDPRYWLHKFEWQTHLPALVIQGWESLSDETRVLAYLLASVAAEKSASEYNDNY